MKKLISSLLFLLLNTVLFAANGVITGKVIDEKGEPLMGASVLIEGTVNGAKADMDGKFTLRNVEDGKYNLVVSYVSFDKKIISDVVVKGGTSEYLNITLAKSGKGLKEVVVKTQMKKESINALQIQQKNLTTISDGISAELIKKTPDRNTGDVLKRVSGVSMADNKFAVIRGLADRYNLAMLNGDILPSSESDRKAFSFDIFPSSLLENIVIVKAATPDRPGEFAGGIIDLTTKDIPNENFLNLELGSGANTNTTFKSYKHSQRSSTDWLGFDKTNRVIPSGFAQPNAINTMTEAQRIGEAQKFKNSWGATEKASAMPFTNFQLSGGYVKRFKKEASFGVIGAISYSNRLRTFDADRNEVNGTVEAYNFKDTIYRQNVLMGSLLNFGLKLNANHKITLKNSFTINSDDQTILRGGDFKDNEYFVRSGAYWFSSNQLLSNQLNSEHVLGKRKIKVLLGVGRNQIARSIPDLRRYLYTRNYDALDSTYTANVNQFPNPFFMGRFFASTKEVIYNGSADVIVPYTLFNGKHSLKAGLYYQSKERDYSARTLSYVTTNGFQSTLKNLPVEELFSEENIRAKGFAMKEYTLPSDQYNATSTLTAAYIMNDNLFADKFRFVYGIRVESFDQQLITGSNVVGDLKISKSNVNVLPSLNFTYLLNKKTNIRLCASQTLSRPEFRELSPASFYDFNMSATTIGNKDLEQTKIQNYDLRYEYFMGKGEMVSASIFYKKFDNPIETTVPFGLTTTQKVFSYVNVPTANSVGLEFEFRKSLSFLAKNEKSTLNDLVVFGNLAYIKSTVEVTTKSVGGEEIKYTRPMQGQSPYIINGGLSYGIKPINASATLVFNRIGERIFSVGNGEIPELYEAPRNVLDFSVTKQLYKKLEIKFTVSDLFANPQVFYYNIDKKYAIVKDENSYNKNKDYQSMVIRPGTNLGLSLSYKF
jgi:outer membrane receptor for ferrienterochelin and colicin